MVVEQRSIQTGPGGSGPRYLCSEKTLLFPSFAMLASSVSPVTVTHSTTATSQRKPLIYVIQSSSMDLFSSPHCSSKTRELGAANRRTHDLSQLARHPAIGKHERGVCACVSKPPQARMKGAAV
jgi:hypothetical protein